MVRAALFDIDGTLIRTRGAGQRAFGAAFKSEFGLADACSDTDFAGRTDRGLATDILTANQLEPSPANIQRVFEGYLRWLAKFLPTGHHDPLPGVQALIDGLRALPGPSIIALLTGNLARGAEIKLRHVNLWQHFAWGIYGDAHDERNALAHDALAMAREKVAPNIEPSELLIIGDTVRDIDCAQTIGARILAVATGDAEKEELAQRKPDLLVDDLTQVTAEEVVKI